MMTPGLACVDSAGCGFVVPISMLNDPSELVRKCPQCGKALELALLVIHEGLRGDPFEAGPLRLSHAEPGPYTSSPGYAECEGFESLGILWED